MMTVERVRHSGAIIVSQFIGEGAGEYLFTRTYYGYTLSEAKAQFKTELKEVK
jgi:ribosomal protein S19